MTEPEKVTTEIGDVKSEASEGENDSETQETIEDVKTQLADMYLDFLDQEKGGMMATAAGLGINNPFKKDAKEFLLSDVTSKNKKKGGIFDKIVKNFTKNFQKKAMEKVSGGTMLEYDKVRLNKMKALITQNKDDQTKLQALMIQIEEGVDPTIVGVTVPITTAAVISTTPEKNTTIEYQDPFDVPAKDLTLTSGFGYRTHPVTGVKDSPHYGIDIGITLGTPIHPIEGGKVIFSGRSDSGGNMITIESDDGRTFSYLHMKDPSLYKVTNPITKVTPTDIIGNIGSTGSSTGPHLHLAEKKDGEFINPLKDEKIASLFKDYKNYETLAASDIIDQDDMKNKV